MNITTALSASYKVTESLVFGAASQNVVAEVGPSYAYNAGTSGNQTDLHWEKKAVTLAAGASVTYTLSALTDDLGRAVALVKLRALLLQITARSAGDYLTLGGAATNPWVAPFGGTTPALKVFTLALLAADGTDAYAVASGASDQLKVTNSGSNPVTFTIALNGTSA